MFVLYMFYFSVDFTSLTSQVKIYRVLSVTHRIFEVMSRYLMHCIVPAFRNRVRQNQMLLSTSSSVNASPRPDENSSTGIDGDPYSINMSDSCIRRMKELHAKETSGKGKMLRLSVEAGGCSGFQYVFKLDGKANPDDRIFEKEGVKLVVDNISYDFVRGATVDYVEELIRAAFLVTQNPSAVGGCSCKSSFMVK